MTSGIHRQNPLAPSAEVINWIDCHFTWQCIFYTKEFPFSARPKSRHMLELWMQNAGRSAPSAWTLSGGLRPLTPPLPIGHPNGPNGFCIKTGERPLCFSASLRQMNCWTSFISLQLWIHLCLLYYSFTIQQGDRTYLLVECTLRTLDTQMDFYIKTEGVNIYPLILVYK